jgi:hypothetical protein
MKALTRHSLSVSPVAAMAVEREARARGRYAAQRAAAAEQQLERRLRAAALRSACSMQHAGDLKIAEVGSEVRGGR